MNYSGQKALAIIIFAGGKPKQHHE